MAVNNSSYNDNEKYILPKEILCYVFTVNVFIKFKKQHTGLSDDIVGLPPKQSIQASLVVWKRCLVF